MGKFLAAIISGIVATVIGGLILNQLQGKGRRRGDIPAATQLVAALAQQHAAPAQREWPGGEARRSIAPT